MNNCKYYQQRLSELHDEGVNLPDEIKTHLEGCKKCIEFYQILRQQAQQLQNLATMNCPDEIVIKTSIIKKIWKTKISVPLPAAVAVFLFAVGLYWLTGNIKQVDSQNVEVSEKQTEIENIQFVKFEPQPALLVNLNE